MAARAVASAASAGLAPGTAPDGVSVPDCVGCSRLCRPPRSAGLVLDGPVLDGAGAPAGALAVP